MKLKFFFIFFLFVIVIVSCSQPVVKNNKINSEINVDDILSEGYELYYLEKASWISTDLILEKYKDFNRIDKFLGYITYRDSNKIISTYWKESEGKESIFSTFTFNDTSDKFSVIADYSLHSPNKKESLLFSCQKRIRNFVASDTNMRTPEGCSFNYVFLFSPDRIRILLLTGTKDPNLIPFGNDYDFSFDSSGTFLQGKTIHPKITNSKKHYPSFEPVNQEKDEKGDYKLCSHHHYGTKPICITSTDICNILLYGKSEYYSVYSREYVSLFTPNKPDKLTIFPMKFFDDKK
jgi:hypothetical protein